MNRADRAAELFSQGYACSQAVLLPWASDLGLDEAVALRIAAPFAAGMRIGSTCGAVTGALMVIGLATCTDECVAREGRAVTIGPTAAFAERFVERIGSLECADIIGCDLRNPDDVARANAEGLFGTCCAPAVRAAAEILEEMFAPS